MKTIEQSNPNRNYACHLAHADDSGMVTACGRDSQWGEVERNGNIVDSYEWDRVTCRSCQASVRYRQIKALADTRSKLWKKRTRANAAELANILSRLLQFRKSRRKIDRDAIKDAWQQAERLIADIER